MRKELHAALVAGLPDVQGRVYPLIMPQDTKKNSVVYRMIAKHDTTGITCTIPISTRFGFQIDVFAHTYGQGVDLMDKIESILRTEFLMFTPFRYEDYQNITLKYRQVLDVQIEGKYVAPTSPVVGVVGVVNYNIPVVNNGKSVIN